jgi:hypothetical protein
MNPQIGKWLMITGAIVFLLGLLLYFFHDKLNWLGKLPGDIRIERAHFKFYFPIATSLLVSLVLTIIIYIIRKL